MRFFFAAILFLAAVVGFSLLAKTLYQGNLEMELEELSLASLADEGLEGVRVSFDYHDAKLSGYVDSEEERSRILPALKKAVPMARIEEEDAMSLPIRPTLPPNILITRAPGAEAILMEGVLGGDGETNRQLFVDRLRSLDGVSEIVDEIRLDPRQLPLEKAAELASIAVELFRESDEARLEFGDGPLKIEGEVSNAGRRTVILDLAERVGAESVEAKISILEPDAPAPPSEFSLTRNRFGVILSGRVGSRESKERLLSVFESHDPSLRVTDRVEIDEMVAPAKWESVAKELIEKLLAVFSGEMTAEFRSEQIRLTGTTETEKSYADLIAFLQGVGNEGRTPEILADVTVLEDRPEEAEEGRASELLITYQPGSVVLTGFLPDIGFVPELEARIREKIPDFAIKNELAETPSASSEGWVSRLSEFLEESALRIETGMVRFGKEGLKMEGMTRNLTDKQILQNIAINSVPTGYSIENLLRHEEEVFPAPDLLPDERDKLTEELRKFPIYFAKNSELIASEEREKLKEIHSLLEAVEFPVKLVATGFADNVGNEEYNRQLSLRRAESVVSALVALGIEKERLSKVSKGEDVSSVSSSERWKARRVEVSLAPISENSETETPSE